LSTDILAAMQHDKKARNGAIRFALATDIGSMARDGDRWTVPVPPALVRTVLGSTRSGAPGS